MPKKEGTIVRRFLDPKKPPKPTEEQLARMRRLADMPDELIDYSDAPPAPDDVVWLKAADFPPLSPKKQITLRLDQDILDYFRAEGDRYQTRINAVLRAYVQAQRKGAGGGR